MNHRNHKKDYIEEDVMTEGVEHMIEKRVPWLFVGLLGGLFATVIVSKFEETLAADVRLAFFIPIIVYLSDAVGTQTETIFVRELSEGRIRFWKYILKESGVGMGLGVLAGAILGAVAFYWLHSPALALTIGLTMVINLTFAPVFAVLIPQLLSRNHSDPALGAGPVATIIQDILSLLVYFLIANRFIL